MPFDHLPPDILRDDQAFADKAREVFGDLLKFAALVIALPGVLVAAVVIGEIFRRAG